jgi:hypothetical protein
MPTEYLMRPRSAAQSASQGAPRWQLVMLEIGAGLLPLFTGRILRPTGDRRPSRPARRKRDPSTRHRRVRRPTRRRMAAVQVAADRGAIRSSCAQGAF